MFVSIRLCALNDKFEYLRAITEKCNDNETKKVRVLTNGNVAFQLNKIMKKFEKFMTLIRLPMFLNDIDAVSFNLYSKINGRFTSTHARSHKHIHTHIVWNAI